MYEGSCPNEILDRSSTETWDIVNAPTVRFGPLLTWRVAQRSSCRHPQRL